MKKEEEKWEEELIKLESLTLKGDEEPEKTLVAEEEVSVDDEDIYLPDLFECTPVFISNKDNNFAYLPESLKSYDLSIFDINSTKTNAFNLGTPESPNEILIASEVTSEKRKNLEELLMK